MNRTDSKTPNKFSYINIIYRESYLFPQWQCTGQDSLGSQKTEESLNWLIQRKEFIGHMIAKALIQTWPNGGGSSDQVNSVSV